MTKEKEGYNIVDRESEIDNLIMWIGECGQDRESDKYLMKKDLQELMNMDCDNVYSSEDTNEYIEIPNQIAFRSCKQIDPFMTSIKLFNNHKYMKPIKDTTRLTIVINKAINLYGAIRTKKDGFVLVNGKTIDLTASGTEDWEIASNIIRQLSK